MTRSAFASALALIFSAAAASGAFAQQATPAAPAPAAGAARAKWVAPVKGVATVQVIRSESKRVAGDLVTNFKIKNVSNGAIALLRIDEYWYDGSQKPQMVTGDTQRWTKPILPGEVVEMSTRSPIKPGAARSQVSFTHANGKIEPKVVKKFD